MQVASDDIFWHITAMLTSEKYQPQALQNLSEEELMVLLKKSWGYREDQPLEVVGVLKEVELENTKIFYLESLRSINDSRALLYPIDNINTYHNAYVGHYNEAKRLANSHSLLKAQVVLSPKHERRKHNNPFELSVITDSIQALTALPDDFYQATTEIDNKKYIEKWIIDSHIQVQLKTIKQKIAAEKAELEEQLTELTRECDEIKVSLTNTKIELADKQELLYQLDNLLQEGHHEQERMAHNLADQKNKMEAILNKLKQLIEEKANILQELDLVDAEELARLTGKTTSRYRVGHNFEQDFASDIAKAVDYIQSFMWHKGIIYSNTVLKDFCALLSTHDLIVLAGDSGSGKTNLIKSFADAIGGKSIIIPVKPNWTSAEDLIGYYNPMEQKYLSTPFLDALFEARDNPEIPYFICLDEMNLARVEYYFADFLSLMEERHQAPKIQLYSGSESANLTSEVRNFLALIDDVKERLDKQELTYFLDLLRDDAINAKLHEICGFSEGDSLLKYHAHLRKLLSSYISTPAAITLPNNVRIIGTINVDETTHYLSPKILDRAHVMRFSSPLLIDWAEIEEEIQKFDLDLELPVLLPIYALGKRTSYPPFERDNPIVTQLIDIVSKYLEPLGIEFGLRAVRQALHYQAALKPFAYSDEEVLNYIVLHKILPKLLFDGNKQIDASLSRKDLLRSLHDYLATQLDEVTFTNPIYSCIAELERVIKHAESNDWVVNYWSR